MKTALRQYPHEYDNQIYLLKIYSEEPDDWDVWVYEEDKITFIEKFDSHEFFEKAPPPLQALLMFEVRRGRANIQVDSPGKKSS